jgi:hypothetical protein
MCCGHTKPCYYYSHKLKVCFAKPYTNGVGEVEDALWNGYNVCYEGRNVEWGLAYGRAGRANIR